MTKQLFEVTGMSCGGCAAGVKRALERKDGVLEVHVDLAKQEVLVTFDASRIQDNAIIEHITLLGYEA